MEVKCTPFHTFYTQYIRKKTITILLGSILVILLCQTPSNIKYIQNDLNAITIDNDVNKPEGKSIKNVKIFLTAD